MKKKQAKKLVLAKETVRSLENGPLGGVEGGVSAACTYTNCCTGQNQTCNTCPTGGTPSSCW